MMTAVTINFRTGVAAPISGVTYYVVVDQPPQIVLLGVVGPDDSGSVTLALDTDKSYFIMSEKAGYTSEVVKVVPELNATYDVTLTEQERPLPRDPNRCRITGRIEYIGGAPFEGTLWVGAPDGMAASRSGKLIVGDAPISCEDGFIDIELDRGGEYLISGVWAGRGSYPIYVPDAPTADSSDILVPYAVRAYRTDTGGLGELTLSMASASTLSALLPMAVDLSDGREGGVDIRKFIEIQVEDRSIAAAALSGASIAVYGESLGVTQVSIYSRSTYDELPLRLPRVLIGQLTVEVVA